MEKSGEAMVAVDQLERDERNRSIERDEDFASLLESVRVLGVLQPLRVRRTGPKTFKLVDGERRFEAAKAIGLKEVPCVVSNSDVKRDDIAAVVLNDQRKAHGALHVARRLREFKNEHGLTHEQVASQFGLALHRVKGYLALFQASDELLAFFEKEDLSLKECVEFMRYEKQCGEAKARKLVGEYRDDKLTTRELRVLRQRQSEKGSRDVEGSKDGTSGTRVTRLIARVEAALEDETEKVIDGIARILGPKGYAVVVKGAKVGQDDSAQNRAEGV